MIRRTETYGGKRVCLGVTPWSREELEGLSGKEYSAALKSYYAVIVYEDKSVISRGFYRANQFNLVKTKLAKLISDETGEPVGVVRKRLWDVKNIPKKNSVGTGVKVG